MQLFQAILMDHYTTISNQNKNYEIFRTFLLQKIHEKWIEFIRLLCFRSGFLKAARLVFGARSFLLNVQQHPCPVSTNCQCHMIVLVVTIKTVSRYFQMSPGDINHSWLKIIGLDKFKERWQEKEKPWKRKEHKTL